jgi:hypothetical protein
MNSESHHSPHDLDTAGDDSGSLLQHDYYYLGWPAACDLEPELRVRDRAESAGPGRRRRLSPQSDWHDVPSAQSLSSSPSSSQADSEAAAA